MMKLALFVGTMCLAINASAITLGELYSTLNKAIPQTAQVPPKMIYGGRDVISPKTITQTTESAQTTVS